MDHRTAPGGIEGWTLNGPIDLDGYRDDKFPFILVIARHGKVIHRLPGDGFIWQWAFLNDGQDVAWESGPLHFSATCYLYQIATWKELDEYDCYHNTPEPIPDWVIALESSR